MLLAIDIGNSSISIGLFELNDGALLHTFKLSSNESRTPDEYLSLLGGMIVMSGIEKEKISKAIIASVVPNLTHTIYSVAQRLVGKDVFTVGPGLKTGFPIKIDNPSELGADLVANAAAVIDDVRKNKRAAIVVDMGTATTISAISSSGEYIGNAIMPGVRVAIDSLRLQTALLPLVTLDKTSRVIGKNSQDSVRSGVLRGHALLIDEFINEFEKEMKINEGSAMLYATGGLGESVISACHHEMQYDEQLTLKGLYCIYKNNLK